MVCNPWQDIVIAWRAAAADTHCQVDILLCKRRAVTSGHRCVATNGFWCGAHTHNVPHSTEHIAPAASNIARRNRSHATASQQLFKTRTHRWSA